MQQTGNSAVVTPSGVRDGNPAALQGLCERRGASVVAYCREVCGPDVATRAAAEAFARFRAAVVALDDVSAIDPEALLLSATRHAAASLAMTPPAPRARRWRRRETPPPEGCEDTAQLLIGRVEGTLDEAQQQRLTGHLERCDACRTLKGMFRHAEVLYRDPGTTEVPPVVAEAIVDALAAAAPVAHAHAVAPVRLEIVAPEAVDVPDALDDLEALELPERVDELEAMEDVATLEPEALDEPADEHHVTPPDEDQDDEPVPARRFRRRRRKTLEFPPVEAQAAANGESEPTEDDPDMPPVAPDDEAAMARVFPDHAGDPPRRLRGLPRPPRQPVHAPDEQRRHGRGRTVVLPAGIVLAAVAGALGIAGVFGGESASPPATGGAEDQLFPKAVLRAPARGTAAAAAAEIARIAAIDRRRAEQDRRLRKQGAAVTPAGSGVAPSAASTPTPIRP